MKFLLERTRAVVVESRKTSDERAGLERSLRRAREKSAQAFDQGFRACIKMIENGADMLQLYRASGVVTSDWVDDTSPSCLYSDDDEITQVDYPIPVLVLDS